MLIAKRKGDKIHKEYPHDVVISADTIVVIDNMIIGKPKDEEDAKRLLKLLSNREHEVLTAYCIYKDDKFYENYASSFVLFNKLNVRQRRIWLIEDCEKNAVCSAEFLPYSSEKIDLNLLSHILYSDKVTNDFIGMSTGTSNSQKRITPKSFLEYEVNL